MSGTLGVQKAADMLNVHPKTIGQLIKDGELAAGKVGRAYILLESDVMAYAEKIIVRQTAERMGVPQRSPKTRGKIAAPKIGIAA